MKVFENKFVIINFDHILNIMEFLWKKSTEEATPEDFKEWNVSLVKQVKAHKPFFILSDNTNYLFSIFPELQEWSVKNVFVPFSQAGLKKLSMIVSAELLAQMSLEQFTDEAKVSKIGFETKYFETEEEARKWLS